MTKPMTTTNDDNYGSVPVRIAGFAKHNNYIQYVRMYDQTFEKNQPSCGCLPTFSTSSL